MLALLPAYALLNRAMGNFREGLLQLRLGEGGTNRMVVNIVTL